MTKEEIRAILYEAAGCVVGVRVISNNPQLLRQRLYTELRALDLDLSIHPSPSSPGNELWIVNKEPPQ